MAGIGVHLQHFEASRLVPAYQGVAPISPPDVSRQHAASLGFRFTVNLRLRDAQAVYSELRIGVVSHATKQSLRPALCLRPSRLWWR